MTRLAENRPGRRPGHYFTDVMAPAFLWAILEGLGKEWQPLIATSEVMGPVRRAASMTSDLDRPPTCCVSRSSNNDGPRDRAHGATDCSAGALVCGIDGRVGRPHAPADQYAVHGPDHDRHEQLV